MKRLALLTEMICYFWFIDPEKSSAENGNLLDFGEESSKEDLDLLNDILGNNDQEGWLTLTISHCYVISSFYAYNFKALSVL